MTLANLLLILLAPFLVVGAVALVAEMSLPGLLRPVSQPPRRPVTRPRPTRMRFAC